MQLTNSPVEPDVHCHADVLRVSRLILSKLETVVAKGWEYAEVMETLRLVQELRGLDEGHDRAQSVQVASILERALRYHLDSPSAGRADARKMIGQAVVQLHILVDQNMAKLTEGEPESAAPVCTRQDSDLVLVLVSSDASQRALVSNVLCDSAYQLELFSEADALKWFLEEEPQDSLLAVICEGGIKELGTLLASVRACLPQATPLIGLSSVVDTATHLELLRAGASYVLPPDLVLGQLIPLLDGCAQRQIEQPVRALLVAEETSAKPLLTAMQQAGMQVQQCDDPHACLRDASSAQVDVIVVNAHVGSWHSIEVAALLRSRHPQAPWALVLRVSSAGCPNRVLDGNELQLSEALTVAEVAGVALSAARDKRAQRATTEALQRALYERQLEQVALDEHAIISTTDRAGRITHVNDTFCEISGYQRHELLGKSHSVVKSGVHDAEFYGDLWRTIRSGRTWHGELCNRRKDGSLYWVESTIMPFVDAEGEPYQYISIRTEISHVKETQVALEQAHTLLERSHEAARIGSWEVDLEADWCRWSEMCRQIHESNREVLRIREALAFVADGWSRDKALHCYHNTVNNQQPFDEELLISTTHGQERWVRLVGQPRVIMGRTVAIHGLVQDIHDRKQAEIDLAEREQQLRESQRIAHLGSWSADLENDDIWWSDEVYRIFGRDPADFVPSLAAFYDQVHPEDLERVRLGQQRAQALGNHELVHRIQRPDGTVRHVRITAEMPSLHVDGPVRFHGVLHDVTERVETERAMVLALEKAERASGAKSEFLSRMSHELRTPMNVILGFAQLLECADDLSAESQDNVREILGAGQHLLALINEVLDLSRVESGHVELSVQNLSLETMFRDCMSLMNVVAEHHEVHLSIQDDAGLCVCADGTRLKQVLMNLLSNAIKYNRPGGRVWLRAELLAENWVRICVEDDGAGIAEGSLERLFQPFERLGASRSNVEGTGIGLTIARRLVEMMGGLLGVESRLGQGSTFLVDLPEGMMQATPTLIVSPDEYDSSAAQEHAYETLADKGNRNHV